MVEWYFPWSLIDWILRLQLIAWFITIGVSYWIFWHCIVRKRGWLVKKDKM